MNPTIVYIPGFNSTTVAFSHIREMLPSHNIILANYDTHQSLRKSIEAVSALIPKKTPVHIVSHSLGGIIACHVAAANQHQIHKIVSISTPFGGSKAAWIMRWIMRSPVMGDITPDSVHIRTLNQLELPPVKSIISTNGSIPMGFEKNDSVVTLNSQLHLQNNERFLVKANHFEVLQHPKTIKIIHDQIWGKL